MLTLGNRVGFITGAAQGIGYEIATVFAENGMNVVIADVNEEKSNESAEIIKDKGLKAHGIFCDVTSVDSIRDSMKSAASVFGGIDVLVNSAGVLSTFCTNEMTKEEWDRVMAVNLGGTFFSAQQALPYLEKSKCARIVNIASNAGRMGGYESSLVYGASKGGVISLTYGLARQLAPQKILVNCIAPGTTKTDTAKAYSPEAIERLLAHTPLSRLGLPREIAVMACYFASEESSFTTGAVVDVNGGMFMG